MKRKKYMLFCLLSLFVVLGASCSKKAIPKKDSFTVMTTFYPIYAFTKEIVGTTGNVTLLVPSGVEVHDYEPTAKDLVQINDADAFIYNSQHMEVWLNGIIQNIDQRKTVVIEAAKDIPLVKDEHQQKDPHVWLDPLLALKEIQTITKELSRRYPQYKQVFQKNSLAYQKKVKALHQTYKKALLDAKNKTFLTQHAAFSYLAKAYQLEQLAVSGLSEDEEPSPMRLAELNDIAKEKKLQAIYFEEQASSKVAQTLAKEANLTIFVLNPLESLSDEKQKKGQDYLSVMENNLRQLQKSIK